EGVIAKDLDSRYDPSLQNAWQKFKLLRQQEFVIGGYKASGSAIDELIVGYYSGRALRFAGKVRAGLVAHMKRELFSKLQPLRVTRCPFTDLPNSRASRWGGGVTPEEMKTVAWVVPELVSEISFTEWTS